LISIESQADLTGGGVDNVTLYSGETPITASGKTRAASVSIGAIGARIELGAIGFNNAGANAGKVTGFQIDGIFINNYYPEIAVMGEASTPVIAHMPANANAAIKAFAEGSAEYPANIKSILYEYNLAAGLGEDDGTGIRFTSEAAPSTNVWAYNMLAPKTWDGSNVTMLEVPNVIVRMSAFQVDPSIKLDGQTCFISVKGFRDKATGNVISYLEPGKVYKIAELLFDVDDLKASPVPTLINVDVDVTLLPWEAVDVEPIL
jgi:hypothetical protein